MGFFVISKLRVRLPNEGGAISKLSLLLSYIYALVVSATYCTCPIISRNIPSVERSAHHRPIFSSSQGIHWSTKVLLRASVPWWCVQQEIYILCTCPIGLVSECMCDSVTLVAPHGLVGQQLAPVEAALSSGRWQVIPAHYSCCMGVSTATTTSASDLFCFRTYQHNIETVHRKYGCPTSHSCQSRSLFLASLLVLIPY